MIPRLSAIVTAWVRSLAPSLESIFVTWLLTVSSVIASWSAITLFALPLAISRSTSISREVRLSSVAWSASSAATSGVFAFCRHAQHGWSPEVLYAHTLSICSPAHPLAGPQHLNVACVRGQNNDSGARKFVVDVDDCLDAIESRHLQVH